MVDAQFAVDLQLKPWQTASTSWKTKPFPVSFANPWTAPVAEPRWGMWHWVQAQDFQWQLLLWLKLNLHLKPGGGQAAAADRCEAKSSWFAVAELFITFKYSWNVHLWCPRGGIECKNELTNMHIKFQYVNGNFDLMNIVCCSYRLIRLGFCFAGGVLLKRRI